MNAELLDRFLSEDGDFHARHKLIDAIRIQRSNSTPIKQDFNFIRFSVTLDLEQKCVFLRDDLTVGPEGKYSLSLEEFERALER